MYRPKCWALYSGKCVNNFEPQTINMSLCLAKSNPMLWLSFQETCTRKLAWWLFTKAYAPWGMKTYVCKMFIGLLWSFAHKLFHWIIESFAHILKWPKHGDSNCSHICKIIWTRKKARSYVLLELWRCLHLTPNIFKEDTTIPRWGDQKNCEGFGIRPC